MGFRSIVLLVIVSGSFLAHAQPTQDLTWYLSFNGKEALQADTVFASSSERLAEAIEIQDKAAQAREYKLQGMLQLTRQRNYEIALESFLKALELENPTDAQDSRTLTYVAIASVFEAVDEPARSAEYLAKGLEHVIQDPLLQAYTLTKHGQMLMAQGKTEAALDNYELVLELERSLDKPVIRAEALANMARALTQQGKLEDALQKYKESLELYRHSKQREAEAQLLSDVGVLYSQMKNSERALANHVAAIDIRQLIKDNRGLAESYNHAAQLYFGQKNYTRALANLQLALTAGNETQATAEIRTSYEYIYLCYKELGDFKQALLYNEKYASLTELLQQEKDAKEVTNKVNRLTIEGITSKIDKLEMERVQREKELEAQKQFRNILMVVIALVGVIAVLVLVMYFNKRRTNKILHAVNEKVQQQNLQLQELNATKDKFFSIISHDLKGPLNSLTSFSGLLINHTDKLSKEDIQMLATDLDKSVKNLFTLLENLLEWSRSQTGNIDFKPEKFDLAEVLTENKNLLYAQAQAKEINLVWEASGLVPVQAHRHSVTTVVRNLLSNAIKFTPQGGTITLSLVRENQSVKVSVQDTGVGMSPEVMDKLFRIDTKHSTKGTANEKGTGLGLILCKDFIEKNGGQISVSSELTKGSVFYFTLPA